MIKPSARSLKRRRICGPGKNDGDGRECQHRFPRDIKVEPEIDTDRPYSAAAKSLGARSSLKTSVSLDKTTCRSIKPSRKHFRLRVTLALFGNASVHMYSVTFPSNSSHGIAVSSEAQGGPHFHMPGDRLLCHETP